MKLGNNVQDMLKALTPEQQAFAKDYAKIRTENKMLKVALSQSEQKYTALYVYLLAILRQMPNYQIAFKRKDLDAYNEFKDAWQLTSRYDDLVDEQVLQLMAKGEEVSREGKPSSTAGSRGPAEEAGSQDEPDSGAGD